jgi:hypothetical protein
MIGSSVNSPIYGVNRLFYLRVRCKITVAVFLTLRWYLSVFVHRVFLVDVQFEEHVVCGTFEVLVAMTESAC